MKLSYRQEREETLLASLLSMAGECGKNRLRNVIKEKQVRINGKRPDGNVTVFPGDSVEAFIPDTFFKSKEIRIIFEDGNLVVADKPAKTDSVVTLPRLLKDRCGAVYPVHRLDTNTTGVIILAKNEEYRDAFTRAFRKGEIRKTYRATVLGRLYPENGILVHYLVKNPGEAVVRAYGEEIPGSLTAETEYETLSSSDGLSELLLKPVTGRTHQLRVQLAKVGHPILGDGKYGDYETNKKYGALGQKLRAVSLVINSEEPLLKKYSGKEFRAE